MRTSTILLVAGLIFLLLAELGGMAQLRVFAVLLLLAGAAGMGVLAGCASPEAPAVWAAMGLLRSSKTVIAVLLLAPTLIPLALAMLQAPMQILMPGAPSAPDANAVWHGGWNVAGALTASLLLAAAATSLAVALRAMRAASPGEKSGDAP